MAWVYAPEGHCYLNTNYIQQIIPQSAGTGQMEALYDDEWVPIEDKWYEYPPVFTRVKP
ncbi:MAG: hypothetical protein M0Q91_10105 [Methanoregula sp.]|jgi:hypothetical protein|nr:hypothetical protein [Methanoregula sp.]